MHFNSSGCAVPTQQSLCVAWFHQSKKGDLKSYILGCLFLLLRTLKGKLPWFVREIFTLCMPTHRHYFFQGHFGHVCHRLCTSVRVIDFLERCWHFSGEEAESGCVELKIWVEQGEGVGVCTLGSWKWNLRCLKLLLEIIWLFDLKGTSVWSFVDVQSSTVQFWFIL